MRSVLGAGLFSKCPGRLDLKETSFSITARNHKPFQADILRKHGCCEKSQKASLKTREKSNLGPVLNPTRSNLREQLQSSVLRKPKVNLIQNPGPNDLHLPGARKVVKSDFLMAFLRILHGETNRFPCPILESGTLH